MPTRMQGRLDDIPRTEPWSELSRDLFGVIAFRMQRPIPHR